MKCCPFCMGEIPGAARKCQHCGEWVIATPDNLPIGDLGQVANKLINYKIITGMIGLIIFLLFFLFVWLPGFNQVRSAFPAANQPTITFTPNR